MIEYFLFFFGRKPVTRRRPFRCDYLLRRLLPSIPSRAAKTKKLAGLSYSNNGYKFIDRVGNRVSPLGISPVDSSSR